MAKNTTDKANAKGKAKGTKKVPAKAAKKAAKKRAAKPNKATIATSSPTVPVIKITGTDREKQTIAFECGDFNTVYKLGDRQLLQPCGDGKHHLLVFSTMHNNTAYLRIGYYQEGGGFETLSELKAEF